MKVNMKKLTTCTVDVKNLEELVDIIQKDGMHVYVTDTYGAMVDTDKELLDEVYLVEVFKTN